MRSLTAISCALLLAACGSSAPTGSPATTAPSGTASPSEAMPTAATPTTGVSQPPTAPPAASPGQGGVTGPVFTGSLADAFPPVIGGEQVQVFGPLPASEMENLDANTLAFIEALGFDPTGVEAAFATDSGSSVFIFAMRFAGADSTTIDSTYIAVQDAAPGTSNFRVVTIAGRNVHAFDGFTGTTYSWVNGDILFTLPISTEAGAQQAIASMPLPTVALAAGGEVLPDAVVDLSIVGGESAGTYHGETAIGGCSRNALGENQFGLAYSDDANPDGFTSLQLVVRDEAAAAETGGTDDFFATVQIGPAFGGTSYSVDPGEGDGTGSVSIVSTGNDTATVDITGETAEGVALEATITCNVIFDFASGD